MKFIASSHLFVEKTLEDELVKNNVPLLQMRQYNDVNLMFKDAIEYMSYALNFSTKQLGLSFITFYGVDEVNEMNNWSFSVYVSSGDLISSICGKSYYDTFNAQLAQRAQDLAKVSRILN